MSTGSSSLERPSAAGGSEDSDQILSVIAAETGLDRQRLQRHATFESLGLTSMDVVAVLAAIEERFDIYLPMDGMMAGARDLGAFVDAVAERLSGRA